MSDYCKKIEKRRMSWLLGQSHGCFEKGFCKNRQTQKSWRRRTKAKKSQGRAEGEVEGKQDQDGGMGEGEGLAGGEEVVEVVEVEEQGGLEVEVGEEELARELVCTFWGLYY